ncbi:hypothetical protein [Chachezhania antarctica]|mgnify:FL=1|uniref:hypothetical protein n=1 Tax=Chachezhania antarctica TaxID=2340860 RepID=UPI000EB44C20|nr:hypothetical protein [Chachezhania antarctica]
MPELIKLYIRSVAIGFGIAAGFVALLLWTNTMGLQELVLGSSGGALALFMLWFMNGIVFAGVQFAYKIMSMAERPEGPRRGTPVMDLTKPVRIKAVAKKREPAPRRF